MKNYYCVGILWKENEELSSGETRCLEESIKRALDYGIEQCVKNHPFYTALYEKAGLIERITDTRYEHIPPQIELHESQPGENPRRFLNSIRQLLKAWLSEPDDNISQDLEEDPSAARMYIGDEAA